MAIQSAIPVAESLEPKIGLYLEGNDSFLRSCLQGL